MDGSDYRCEVYNTHSKKGMDAMICEMRCEEPDAISLDQSRKSEEIRCKGDQYPFFQAAQWLRIVGKELWKGVGRDAVKFFLLFGVVRAMAAKNPHLNWPQKGKSHDRIGHDRPPRPGHDRCDPHPDVRDEEVRCLT